MIIRKMRILEETKRVCLEGLYQHCFIVFLYYVPRGYNVSKAKEHISGASFPKFFCAAEKTIKKALFNNPIVRLRSSGSDYAQYAPPQERTF